MAKIRFENIKKGFNDVIVVKDLNLTIKDGEFFTFVGPSGCGKSTILNMIAGLEPATEGKIYFNDLAVNELTPRERDVAMVFQSYALYPHMTVYENIAFPLRMKQISGEAIDGEVKRIATLLGLENILYRKPKELSGGQRQRVALGRAIIRKPKVFLMDEPLSNLDARLRVEMRAELKNLHQKLKITTIYVTHDQAEAMSLSERIAALDKGEIQQCGIPLEIYTRPANTFVAGFIGSPPMNFINATVFNKDPFTVMVNNTAFNPIVKRVPETDKVIIGIRPEDVLVLPVKEEGTIEALAEITELEGSVIWVRMKWNGISIKGKMSSTGGILISTNVYLKIPADKLHIFDYNTGARL